MEFLYGLGGGLAILLWLGSLIVMIAIPILVFLTHKRLHRVEAILHHQTQMLIRLRDREL